jgi:hypothetical protein
MNQRYLIGRVLAPAWALIAGVSLFAWDYEGHRMVNQLALASLPADFPAFVREPAAAERIAFLSGEPDRWRNVPDLPLRHYNGMDHYCDLEQLADAGLDAATVPSLRYEFAAQFAAGRAAHAGKFPPVEPTKNTDHSREWPGFSPWAITEYYGKLKSAFAYLKAFDEAGTPEEIANARADIIYLMGVMGHYVADSAQPLHTTMHHNGWVGPNPNGYTTWPGFHAWIDGGFGFKAGIKLGELVPRVTPAQLLALANQPDGRDPVFVDVMNYLLAQNQLVEPLYQLEKAGKLSNDREKAERNRQFPGPVDAGGRAFVEGQLLKGGEMLGALWLTAWKQAGPDVYLRAQLLKRQAAPAAK